MRSEKTEYRIVAKAPGHPWQFHRFTGAVGLDRELIEQRMERAKEESPGWLFRIEARVVVIDATDWVPVDPGGDHS